MTTGSDVDVREARLPKWAQEELALLRMRLAEANDAFFKAYQKAGPESDIVVNPYSRYAHTLIGRPNIGFHLRRGDAHGVLHVRHRGSNVNIMWSADRGDNQLLVLPESSNVVTLMQGDR